MNPRDPRNRRNRPTPAEGAHRAEQLADVMRDEFRAQVVRLPVDSDHDNADATSWVVPRWLPDVPPAAGPVAGSLACPDCGARMLEGACLAGCLLPEIGATLLEPAPQDTPPRVAESPTDSPGLPSGDDIGPSWSAAPARLAGWTSRHDKRSLKFAVRDRLARRVPVQTLIRPPGPILDQGTAPPLSVHDASACTGFAGVAAANALHGTALGEVEARELYALAQKRDDLAGEAYPGAPILAVMKAGQEAGYWSEYWWCFGTRDLAQAVLQIGPVLLGVAWSEQLNHPNAAGVAVAGGPDLGGHAIACLGIRTDLFGGPHFVLQQSYGPSVGSGGLLYVQHKDLARMLAGRGEAAIPLTDAQLAAL